MDGLNVLLLVVTIVCTIFCIVSVYGRPSQSSPPRGFDGACEIIYTDFRFKFFVVRKFISAAYLLSIFLATACFIYGVLSIPVAMMEYREYLGIYNFNTPVLLMIAPVVIIVILRFLIESIIAVITIAENTSVIAAASTKEAG